MFLPHGFVGRQLRLIARAYFGLRFSGYNHLADSIRAAKFVKEVVLQKEISFVGVVVIHRDNIFKREAPKLTALGAVKLVVG